MSVEFRWLDGQVIYSDEHLPEGIHASIPRKKILQYRVMQNLGGGIHEWSTWMDVPTVKWEDTYGQWTRATVDRKGASE